MSNRPQVSVSVVMGVFGAPARLPETVASVLGQDFRDLELIIVDDGSTDPEVGWVLERHARRDSRVRLVRKEHGGLTRALIEGCRVARGRYVARIDAGDVMLPARLSRQVAVLDSYPECSLVSCWAKFHGPRWETLWVNRGAPPDKEPVRVVNGDPRHGLQADVPHHGTVMLRKATYEAVGGYRDAFYYGQDWDLWYRLAERGNFMIVPEILYHTRFFPDSLSLGNAERQRAIAGCSLGAYVSRRHGESEHLWLDRASRIRPKSDGSADGGAVERNCEPGQYFIGEALRRNSDPRCRGYLIAAVREAPWKPRAYVRLVQALVQAGRVS